MKKTILKLGILISIIAILLVGIFVFRGSNVEGEDATEDLAVGDQALTAFQGGTGTTSPSGILYGDSTIRLKTVTIGSNLTFSGGTLSASGGGGSGTVSTSTNETAGSLSYWTSNSGTPALLGSVATGTVSSSGGITTTSNRSVIGGSLSVACDVASGAQPGCLASADWTTFNNKVAGTRALTVAGTANQITSSAGSQDLSADRTWTLSLPSHVIFPSSFQATSATTTNATSTNHDITNLLTFNGVTGNSWDDFCTTITGGAGLCDGTDATGSGGSSQWATSTDNTSIYPSAGASTPVIVGATATTSTGSILNVTGQSYFTGNVGIGTSSPYAKLSVVGQTVSEYFTATSTTATSTFPNINITNGEYGGDYIDDFTGTGLSVSDGILSASTDAETLDSIDSASFLRSDASDNYTSGTLTLDASTTFTVSSTNVSFADTSISFTGASTNFAITGNFSINTNDIFVVKADGDVVINGIATTSASFAFDVSDNLLLIGTSGAGDKAFTFFDPSAVAKYTFGLDDSDSDALVLANSGALGTTNLWRTTTATTTILNAVEFEADSAYYYSGSDYVVEAANGACGVTVITNTPGNGILTLTPVTVTTSCTIQYPIRIPGIINGEDVVIRSSDIYYLNADATSLIDVNQFVYYVPSTGTATANDNDTTDITDSSTSHAQSGFPLIVPAGATVYVRITATFNTTTGAGNTLVLRGGKIGYDSD